MPFSDLDKESMINQWLARMFSSFYPTLDAPVLQGGPHTGTEMPTIYLWPTQQGSQMPQAKPDELMRRSRERPPGGPA